MKSGNWDAAFERNLQRYDEEEGEGVWRFGGYPRRQRHREQVGECFFCGKEIYDYEEYFLLDTLDVCSDYDCRYAAFSANGDAMLIQFALEWELLGDAMEWFFDTYARKGNEDR